MVSSNMQFLLSMCFLALAICLRAELRAQRRERLKQEIRQNQSAFQNEYNARLQEIIESREPDEVKYRDPAFAGP